MLRGQQSNRLVLNHRLDLSRSFLEGCGYEETEDVIQLLLQENK